MDEDTSHPYDHLLRHCGIAIILLIHHYPSLEKIQYPYTYRSSLPGYRADYSVFLLYSHHELVRTTQYFCLLMLWVSPTYSVFSSTHEVSWLDILSIFPYSWRELVLHTRYFPQLIMWVTTAYSVCLIHSRRELADLLSMLDLLTTWVGLSHSVVHTYSLHEYVMNTRYDRPSAMKDRHSH